MSVPPTQIKSEPQVKQERNANDEWQTIPLKSCGEEDFGENARVHIMKFAFKNNVDIVNDFAKPVRLHRKDPRNMQFHLTRQELDQRKREKEEAERQRLKEAEAKEAGKEKAAAAAAAGGGGGASRLEDEPDSKDKADSKEKADQSKIAPEEPKLMRGQADLSQIAPDGKARKNKKNMFKKKTKQINLMDEGKRKLRYEEHYPWVIEDYTGKNVYVGNYEAGSTELQNVLFVFDKDGFKMIPAEKVYRFTPRNKYATLTLEEAEAKMERNSSVPRWLMKHMENDSLTEGSPDQRFRNNGSSSNGRAGGGYGGGGGGGRGGVGGGYGGGAGGGRGRMRSVLGGDSGASASANDRDSDHDDLDFEEEFADDEEAPIMDGDEEENKMSERKIKKEMLKAAHLKAEEDAEVDDDLDDLFETEKSRKVDKEGKKLRKMLNKREGGIYDSEDDEREQMPYLSRSDLESEEESETENIKVKVEGGTDSGAVEEIAKKPVSVRRINASYLGDGFVLVKAPKEFLDTLPPGEWSPNGRKRPSPSLESPMKKIKLENEPSLASPSKRDFSPSGSPTPVPAKPPSASSTHDLNDAGPSNLLVTIKDVLDIVRNHPLTTKELLVGLKSRVSAHVDNKQRIISIVKQNLKLVDGKLALRD
ncbi:uncharacterized protein LODBEIA_P48760 [Lodderomyces beijingensis]|uniref:Transcription initiation factor IIF subunit alpha n=1 Tax=Lodderomyces beijingensis TaxID=1775926 RepID=A0ABP0ZVM0_9ASCO